MTASTDSASRTGLAGEEPLILSLPAPVNTSVSPAYEKVNLTLAMSLSRLLLEKSGTWQTPAHHIVVAAGHLLFYRYSGQERFSLRSTLPGRAQDARGGDIQLGAISADFASHATVSTHIAHVHQQFIQLADSRGPAVPARALAAETTEQGVTGATCVCFVAEGSQPDTPALDRSEDLYIEVFTQAAPVEMCWRYSPARFDSVTITRMSRQLAVVLEHALVTPEQQATTAPFLTAHEKRQMLVEWNDTYAPLPARETVHQLFEEQAARRPTQIAVVYKDRHISYRELNEAANELAHRLLEMGVQPGQLIGVCIARSLDMITALLAILKVGAAYLPLDARYPYQRLLHMVRDARANLLLTQERHARTLADLPVSLICLNNADRREQPPRAYANPGIELSGQSLAYVNYTSGSTGSPKGVSICHRNIVRLVTGENCVRLTATNRILQHATICFDAATFEIWGALIHGATCVLFAEKFPTLRKLGRCIENNAVTTMFLTSAFFNTIIEEMPAILRGVEQVLVGGEALSPYHVRKGLQQLPDTELINGYGPTESTTFAGYHLITDVPESAATIPIGRPLCNTQMYILDGNRQLVPVGAVGELYIGGDGLALNYLNQPELTRQKFLDNFSFLDPGVRLYRTGDLARYLPGGEIDLLGRIDGQVKIHGFRIELGEIESALCTHPTVRQAAVVAHCIVHNEKQLIAYITTDGDVDTAALNRHLLTTLPRYMLPSSYHRLDNLPLTRNGKLDRKQLAAMANTAPKERGGARHRKL